MPIGVQCAQHETNTSQSASDRHAIQSRFGGGVVGVGGGVGVGIGVGVGVGVGVGDGGLDVGSRSQAASKISIVQRTP